MWFACDVNLNGHQVQYMYTLYVVNSNSNIFVYILKWHFELFRISLFLSWQHWIWKNVSFATISFGEGRVWKQKSSCVRQEIIDLTLGFLGCHSNAVRWLFCSSEPSLWDLLGFVRKKGGKTFGFNIRATTTVSTTPNGVIVLVIQCVLYVQVQLPIRYLQLGMESNWNSFASIRKFAIRLIRR